MVFFDGTEKSLDHIMAVMDAYSQVSGLNVNTLKSEIYMAGRVQDSLVSKVNSHNFKVEKLPVRYLGLPLTTKTMTKQDFEPLIDRIRSRFLSWKNKSLSFAGRLQLIKSVIASITNFWCSVFKLPLGCLDLIESMCSAYLWSGSPLISTKAKVSWEEVTRPKTEGGLGIRKLRDTSLVFSLSLIWRLLGKSGTSLWASWVNHYLLRGKSFWEIKCASKGSWIWRKLLHLRELARGFIRVDIRDGTSTNFWFDVWSDFGRLIDVLGDAGIRLLGLNHTAKVVDACQGNCWNFRRVRNVFLSEIIEEIKLLPPPSPDAGHDIVQWRYNNNEFKTEFNAKVTWHQIRHQSQPVQWSKIVWFTYGVPKFSFIAWLAILDRLSIGDRAAIWGAHQPCLLCGEQYETRDHLFFACPYSFTVWNSLCSKLIGRIPTPDWTYTINSLILNRKGSIDNIIYRIL